MAFQINNLLSNLNMKDSQIFSLENLNTKKELGRSYNIDKITDKIFLGSIEGLSEYDYFKKEQIENILSITSDSPKIPVDKNINHKVIIIDDFFSENIIKYFKECIEFIENSNKIYIHCTCGVSRSATIVLAYLMWKTHLDFDDIYSFVKKRRPEIDPNNGFRRQLKLFQKLLKENNYDLNKINFIDINI